MSHPKLVAAVVLGLLVGTAIGWFAGTSENLGAQEHPAKPDDAAPGRPAPAKPHSVNGAVATPAAARTHTPGSLRTLLQRYVAETDPNRKRRLFDMLLQMPTDEVLPFALSLANDADPSARLDGLALLGSMPFDRKEVRETFLTQLGQETAPSVQVRMLEMLTPSPLPREDRAAVLEKLERLRASADPEVRAASVVQSAQWGAGGNEMEEILHRALLDPSVEVRRAAITGMLISPTRSGRVKDALLLMAADAAPGSEGRRLAVEALSRFDLTREEFAIYRDAARSLEQDGK